MLTSLSLAAIADKCKHYRVKRYQFPLEQRRSFLSLDNLIIRACEYNLQRFSILIPARYASTMRKYILGFEIFSFLYSFVKIHWFRFEVQFR